jgi:ribonuclease P protein component
MPGVQPGRLKKRADFLRVAKGSRYAMPGLVLQMAPRPDAPQDGATIADSRLGFTVTKKVGIAVIRNRAKRRLRAIAAELMPKWGKPGRDYVLIGRDATATRPFSELLADLEHALQRIERRR